MKNAFAGLVIILASASPVVSAQSAPQRVTLQPSQATQINRELATLKSARDVYMYLQSTPKNISPLMAMDPVSRDRFVRSLRFNEKGLTEFDYTALQSLTASEVYRILSLFGMEAGTYQIQAREVTPLDHQINHPAPTQTMRYSGDFLEGYYCEGQHTCSQTVQKACTSNC